MTVSNYPRRVESDADQMINTLFIEIEQVLEQSNHFETLQWEKREYFSWRRTTRVFRTQVSEQRDRASQLDFSPHISPFPENYVVEATEFHDSHPYPEPNQSQPLPLWVRHLDKIIFSSSCSLFFWALFLLEKESNFSLLDLQQLQAIITNPEPEAEITDTNPEFLHYMERALAQIDRENKLAQKVKSQTTPPPTPETKSATEKAQTTPPPTPETKSVTEKAQTTPPPTPETKSVTEKAQTTPPKTESVVVSPSSPPAKKTEVSSLPALPPPPPPKINNQPTPPQPEPQPSSPQPSEPKPAPPQAVESEVAPPKPTPQQPAYTLVGLLELGEHSAALVKTDNITQRVMLEETIPGSNWRLVSVANQKAVFVNNAQQKFMSVGEKFSVN